MNGLLLMCSIAILTTVYALPPGLSDSFYMQATGTQTINFSGNDIIIEFSRYNIAVDSTRLLGSFDSVSTTSGVEIITSSIDSGIDELSYTNNNGTCTTSSINSTEIGQGVNLLFGEFDTGIENPSGTITYTSTTANGTNILITVNGLPTALTMTSTSAGTTVLSINSYTNSAPPFLIFVLPDACSSFTCDSCYSPSATTMSPSTTTMSPSATTMSPTTTPSLAAGVASSFLLMLAALVMFLFSTV